MIVSSVILLVIVAAWAVVLVPMLLNRHDAANEARSVDRFATAMRVLARRSATPVDQRYVVVPPRPDRSATVVVNAATRWEQQAADARRRVAEADESHKHRDSADPLAVDLIGSRVTARRRRNLLTLIVVVIAALPAAILITPMLWLLDALAALLLAGYVVHLRRAAIRRDARRDRRVARAERALSDQPLETVKVRPPPASQPVPPANAVVIERQQDGSWLPVPVPLPTYVEAPRAPRPAPAQPVVASVTEEELDRHLDELERRLAVNE